MVLVYFTGQNEFFLHLKAMQERAEAETPDALNEILRLVAMQQKTLLNLGSHPPGTKTGSPPGSPPWRISGDLSDSVQVRLARPTGRGRWAAGVGPTIIYGRIQELGGGPFNLPARPSLRPAWDLVRPTIPSYITAAWG